MIIKKYIHREIIKIFLPSLFILVSIFLSSALVKYLNYASRGELSINYLPKLLLIEVPGFLGILIPVALFFSILIALSRFFAQNEMIVLQSAGMSDFKLIRSISGLVVLLFLLVSFFVFWLRPQLMLIKADLMAYAKSNAVLDMFKPGRFQLLGKKNPRTIYINKLSKDNHKVEGIFSVIPNENKKGHSYVLVAKSGYLDIVQDGRYFVLEDGNRYNGKPGDLNYRVTRFGTYKSLLKRNGVEVPRAKIESLPTLTLLNLAAQNSEIMAELQWRISIPLMLAILALLAIPLSCVPPRSGQYANFIPAILLLVVYINGVLVIRDAIEDAKINPVLGVWWYHLIFLFLAVILFQRRFK